MVDKELRLEKIKELEQRKSEKLVPSSEVFSAGFSAEKSASEPLTKDKIIHGLRNDYVDIKNIKSALEEFEKILEKYWGPPIDDSVSYDVRVILKKAFPAIYEPTDKGSEVEKEKRDE